MFQRPLICVALCVIGCGQQPAQVPEEDSSSELIAKGFDVSSDDDRTTHDNPTESAAGSGGEMAPAKDTEASPSTANAQATEGNAAPETPMSKVARQMISKRDAYLPRLEELRARAKAAVVEWKHADRAQRDRLPFWEEFDFLWRINNFDPAPFEWNKNGAYAHGFDRDRNLVTIKAEFPYATYEMFFVRSSSVTEEVQFEFRADNTYCALRIYETVDRDFRSVDRWDRVSSYLWTPVDAPNSQLVERLENGEHAGTEFVWDFEVTNGDLSRVVRTYPQGSKRLFYCTPDSRDVAVIAKELEDALVESVPRIVREAKLTVPVFSVMVCYCGADIYAIPLSGILAAAETDRRGHRLSWGKGWHPGEYMMRGSGEDSYHFDNDPPGDFTVDERKLRLLYKCYEEQSVDETFDGPGLIVQTIRRAARRLNELDWSEICPVTEGFVVVAADNTGDDAFKANIEASVTPEQLKKLNELGLMEDVP